MSSYLHPWKFSSLRILDSTATRWVDFGGKERDRNNALLNVILYFFFLRGQFFFFIFRIPIRSSSACQCFKILKHRQKYVCVRTRLHDVSQFLRPEVVFAGKRTNGKCWFIPIYIFFCHPNHWWWTSFYVCFRCDQSVKHFRKIVRFNQVIVDVVRRWNNMSGNMSMYTTRR